MVTKKEETKIMDYVIKMLIKEERKVEEVIMPSRYIPYLVQNNQIFFQHRSMTFYSFMLS